MKSNSFSTIILGLFLFLNAGFLQAQGSGCSNINFTPQNIGPCHYRLLVANSSECYPEIRLLLDTGGFLSWTAQNGWTAELISPTELLLTHSSGQIPLGASTPIDFYLTPGEPVMTILWDYICSLGKSCFFEVPLASCAGIPGGCISGVNYVAVSCSNQPYSNQPTLAGWTITLLDAMGNTVESTQTNASGAYSFCDLPAGTYVVKKTNQPGWTSSVPASGQTTVVLNQSAQVVRNFGSCRANCLCSYIQTTVQQITTSPTACCYSLSTTAFGSGDYCFQYINVQVDAGLTITPSSTLSGWTTVQNGPQSITITPPNGFVPNGSVTPVTFCVSGGTSHSILATAGYNDSAGAHECDNFFSFSCPNCNCPPPDGLAVSNVGATTATISWIPASCSESTWVYVEDGVNPAEHISRPAPVDSIVLDGLVQGRRYLLYAFSMCNGVMSGPSDTIVFYVPCPGLCTPNLVSNGSFSEPYVFFPTIPNAPDQIGLCPGWQATANGSGASGIGDWFMYGSPFDFPNVFPGSYYDAVNNQYTFLPPYCDPWHAGIDLNTCEGISTQLTSPITQLSGYTLGFWWALREPVASNFRFQAILSGAACTMNTTNAGTICTRQCGNDISIPVQVTTSHQPGVWYFHSFTSNALVTVNHLTFAADASGPTVSNYVYIDEVCLYNVWLPCDVSTPRIAYNPEQPNTFLGEADLGAGSSNLLAVWDFGDGTRDSSCCPGSVIHDFAPGTYEVCLTVTAIDTSGTTCSNATCIQVDIPEVNDQCNDVTATLQSTGLGNCCYNLSINNAALNYFTAIEVTLSSGSFVNSIFGPGWNISLNGNMATLTPINGSGFINAGIDIPLTICDPEGTGTSYTVDVDFVYNGGVCHQSLAFSCDPALCTCQGFQNMSFYNFLNMPDISVNCNDVIQLPCIGSDATYNFQAGLQCQGNCIPVIHYDIFPQSGPAVLSGTVNGTGFVTGFKFPPGDYHIVMTGQCGGNTCTCTVNFTIPACSCCSQSLAEFNQNVVNASTVALDPVNCKATLTIANLPCVFIESVDWGDGVITGPYAPGAMPMHNYAYSGPYTITYIVQETNPFTGETCFEATFTKDILLDCDCSCGTYDLEIRLGGAQNQPIVCGQTIQLGLNQGFVVYSKFQCQGTNCEPSELVTWSLSGPGGLSVGSSDLATPNFNITALSPGSFSTPGLYTFNMYAICGLQDTCWCALYFNVADPCCTDQATFLANAAAVQTNGILGDCFIGMQAVGLSDCMRITYDWGDNNTSGPITGNNIPVTHTYAAAGNYTVCYTIEEIDFFGNVCWSFHSCEQVTVLCNTCCAGGGDLDILVNLYVSVSVDDTPCSVAINIGDLPACFYLDSINWGDGNISFGPYGAASSILHTYESEGPYTITFIATQSEPGSGAVCFQKSFSQTVDPVCFSVCPCLGFSNLIFSPGQGGGPQSVTCGTDVILPCQPGVTYTLTGTLPCLGTGVCPPTGTVTWQLFGPQGLVDAGTTTASPGFSIPLPSGYFYATGTYALIINGQCGSTPCPCTIYFVVNPPCPALCPCDVADFEADVLAGFSTTYYTLSSCKVCFKGIALGPCDMVEWSVDNGPFSTPIPGNQTYCYSFTGNGMHMIEMRVTRKKGVNLICEIFTFQKTITVNCKPVPITIGGPRTFNPGSHNPTLPLAPDNEISFRGTDTVEPGGKTPLRIFPNPNPGAFSVELPEPAAAGTRFRIVGMTGQILREQSAKPGSSLQTVEAGDLPGGLYFLQVLSEGNVIATEKFVKQ